MREDNIPMLADEDFHEISKPSPKPWISVNLEPDLEGFLVVAFVIWQLFSIFSGPSTQYYPDDALGDVDSFRQSAR